MQSFVARTHRVQLALLPGISGRAEKPSKALQIRFNSEAKRQSCHGPVQSNGMCLLEFVVH